MRQQPGLLQDQYGHSPYIGQRVVVPVGVEPFASLRPPRFGTIPKGEKRFETPGIGTCSSDCKNLVW